MDTTKPPETKSPDTRPYRRRDADSLFVMGCFFTVLSIAVLVGTFWAEDAQARLVNVVSGAVLFLLGIGAAAYGLSVKRKRS